ncbi:MAG: universal stress protein [Balneolaceae bacterium]|nr:universal stress protein [Balneolaceae bacterium]
MLDLDHILFPTDFSYNAENALPFALEVARHTGARLTIFHVIETPAYVPHNSDDLPKTHSEKARTLLERVADDVRSSERYGDLEIEAVLQNGNVVTEIEKQADTHNVNLIVMGTKGKTTVDRILYGSIASHIILDTDIPVLAIPENSSRTTFDPITFATDFREGDWPALKETLDWVTTFDAQLNVLHVTERHDFDTDIKFRGFRNFVREHTDRQPIQFDLVVQNQFLTGVADYLTDHPVGLLVLVRYNKNRLQSLIKKNHTKEMSYYTKVPLLVLAGREAPFNRED